MRRVQLRAVAGEIESGAAELLFTLPISRATYFVTHVLFTLLSLGLLSLAGVVGTSLGQAVFDMPLFGAGALLTLALGYSLLQSAWYGIALTFSSYGHEGGRVAGIGFLLAVVSFFAQAIGRGARGLRRQQPTRWVGAVRAGLDSRSTNPVI